MRSTLRQPNHKLSAAEIDALCAQYRAGAAINALCEQFDLYHQTVRAHLTRRGVPIRVQPKPLSPDQREQVLAMRASGMLQREIAAKLECSARSVRRALASAKESQL